MKIITLSTEVEIDLGDLLNKLSDDERKYIFECLQEDGYINEDLEITEDGEVEFPNNISYLTQSDDFNNALAKLHNNGWKLSKKEEEYIISLSKRFV